MTINDKPHPKSNKVQRGSTENKSDFIDPASGAQVYFETVMWKDMLPVYKCSHCGSFYNLREDIVSHVLLHYPPEDREGIARKLKE
jgi:hypothetical protein